MIDIYSHKNVFFINIIIILQEKQGWEVEVELHSMKCCIQWDGWVKLSCLNKISIILVGCKWYCKLHHI